jgi:hypothetical protein
MKRFSLLLVVLCIANFSFSQTNQLNQQKYWKLRNSFRHSYIRIGDELGESLPMERREFGKCVDNTSMYGGQKYGWLHWGDGVIRQGHYIGFLATEYRLLKNNNKDVTAVTNELYYALQAFNRLDKNAEKVISNERENITPIFEDVLNGFYLRDDAEKDFELHWKDEPIAARAMQSRYENNNSGHVDNGTDYKARYGHTFGWNEPSLDQMTSMLVGLKVCHKLLDDGEWVQPEGADTLLNLKQEVIQITHRLVSYAEQHNWFLLDMYGLPVENGGGELAFTALPISQIGTQITGINYDSEIKRTINGAYLRPALIKRAEILTIDELLLL